MPLVRNLTMATTSADGLMSATDKTKLEGIAVATAATAATAATMEITSTDDATSSTAAPLKSAGGLAVVKKGIFGGGIGVGNSSTTSPDVTGTTKSRKIEVFDASGSSIGYLQVYSGS